jgi:hypothetical protein
MEFLQDLNPTSNLLFFNRVDKFVSEDSETTVAEFIQQNQKEKENKKILLPFIMGYIFKNEKKLTTAAESYTNRKRKQLKEKKLYNPLTFRPLKFNHMVLAADGWPADELNTLYELAKKNNISKFTAELISIL